MLLLKYNKRQLYYVFVSCVLHLYNKSYYDINNGFVFVVKNIEAERMQDIMMIEK